MELLPDKAQNALPPLVHRHLEEIQEGNGKGLAENLLQEFLFLSEEINDAELGILY